MTVMTAENVLSHLSHPLGLGQRDKSGFYGTANGTRAGQGSLKALALNVLRRDSTWDESGTIVRKLVGQNNEKKAVLPHMDENLHHSEVEPFVSPAPVEKGILEWWWKPWPKPGTGELPTVFIHRGHVRHAYEDGTTRLVGIAAAPDVPNGSFAQWMKAAPHPDPTPKDVDIPDTLYRLVALDTNIAALVGWGLVPHLQDGELVIDGLDALDAESRAGLERWLAHAGPNGEPRRERVLRALRTGRKATC